MIINRESIDKYIIFATVIWLQSLNILFISYGGFSSVQLQIMIFVSFPISLLLLFLPSQVTSIDLKIIILFYLMLFLFLIGVFFNSSFETLARSLNFAYLNIFAFLFILKVDNGYKRLLRLYALTGIITLLIIYFLIAGSENRAELLVHPNFIGMVTLSIILASIYLKSVILVLTIYIESFIILLLVSSRASLLAALIILFLEAFYFKKIAFLGIKKPFLKVSIIFVYITMGIIYGYNVLNNMFLMDDDHRGMGTGMSGRTDRWIYAFNEWFDNFWLGVGYGESISTIGFSIDNAYLTILFEIGVIGFIVYCLIMCLTIYESLKTKKYLALLFILIYLLYGILEKRYFSIGNSFSILFLFTIYYIFSKNPTSEVKNVSEK